MSIRSASSLEPRSGAKPPSSPPPVPSPRSPSVFFGVGAAVEHVHHRHRQDVRGLAAEVAPQRQALLHRGRVGGGERDAEDRVRAEARLVRRAVELDERAVEALLVRRVAAGDRLGDLAVDVLDRLGDALAAERRATIA
jgi:hypothetical protein